MMFEVPNLGLRHEQLKKLVNGQPNDELVNCLMVNQNSEPSHLLDVLHERFSSSFLGQKLKVISYYETHTTPTTMVSSLAFRRT